jgi:hypothetical protein
VKLGLVLRDLHGAEKSLAEELLTVSDRHRADHEVHHVARDLAGWSARHVRELAAAGPRYGLDLPDDPPEGSGPLAGLRERASELLGRRPEPALALLADLRHLYLSAAGVSLDWVLLAQGAQAAKDTDLLALTQRCHPQTLRQVRWANATLKELAPQALTS